MDKLEPNTKKQSKAVCRFFQCVDDMLCKILIVDVTRSKKKNVFSVPPTECM